MNMSGRHFKMRDNSERSEAQDRPGTSVQGYRGPRGRGQASNGAPRWMNHGQAQLWEPSPQPNFRNRQRLQTQGPRDISVREYREPCGRGTTNQAANGAPRCLNQEPAQLREPREYGRPRGRGNTFHQAPRGSSRLVKQAPVQLGEEEQLVEDLLRQLEESNAENEKLRADLQRKCNVVKRRAPKNALEAQLMEANQLNKTLQDDLKATEERLFEAMRSRSELQRQISLQQDTRSKETEAQVDDATGQETGDRLTKLKQLINKNTSLECYIKNLQATNEDWEELVKDKDCRLNETRLLLQKKYDELEIEKEDKMKLHEDVRLMEVQLCEVQIRKDEMEKDLVRRLQKARNESQQAMTKPQKQELAFKAEMQEEQSRNAILEERLKVMNQNFQKKQCEMEVSLRKTQDQLKKVEGENKAYRTQVGRHLTDNNTVSEKEVRKMVRNVALLEKQLYKMQTQKEIQEKLVENLQKTLNEQQETITNLQKQEARSKTELQAEQSRNRNLEQRLKKSNQILEKTKCEQDEALKQEAQIRKQLQTKVSALEKALEEQQGSVRNLKTLLKSDRNKFKELASKFSAQFSAVVEERNELIRTVADQQQTKESDEKQIKELSQALSAEQVKTSVLQQETEKKRKSKWKFWQRF